MERPLKFESKAFEGSLQVKCPDKISKDPSGSFKRVFLCDIIDSPSCTYKSQKGLLFLFSFSFILILFLVPQSRYEISKHHGLATLWWNKKSCATSYANGSQWSFLFPTISLVHYNGCYELFSFDYCFNIYCFGVSLLEFDDCYWFYQKCCAG